MAHDRQIIGEYPPTYPSDKAILAPVEAAVEAIFALDHADTPLNTGMPAAATAEPGLLLVAAAFRRESTDVRKDDVLNTQACCLGFAVW